MPWRMAAAIVLVVASATSLLAWSFQPRPVDFGVTYSPMYAGSMDVNPNDGYLAVMDDLGIRKIRLPVTWSEIEPSEGNYQFSTLDWMMNEAAMRGTKVTLAIGLKVPRWPECFIPDWTQDRSATARDEAMFAMLKTVVERYRGSPALERWQVENEPFFPFGDCPAADPTRYLKEVMLVRLLDPNHAIMSTTSGEHSLWASHMFGVDVVGATTFLVVVDPTFGLIVKPFSVVWYGFQAMIVRAFGDDVLLSEVQAEPWGVLRYDAFTADDLMRRVDFVRRTGVNEAYLWGVEWWYVLHVHGDDRLWNAAKEIF